MVFDGPHGVEGQRVGELDLLNRFPIDALFAFALPVRVRGAPGLGSVHFLQDVELHGTLPADGFSEPV